MDCTGRLKVAAKRETLHPKTKNLHKEVTQLRAWTKSSISGRQGFLSWPPHPHQLRSPRTLLPEPGGILRIKRQAVNSILC